MIIETEFVSALESRDERVEFRVRVISQRQPRRIRSHRRFVENDAVFGRSPANDGQEILDGQHVLVRELVDEPVGRFFAELEIVFDVGSKPQNVSHGGRMHDLETRMS